MATLTNQLEYSEKQRKTLADNNNALRLHNKWLQDQITLSNALIANHARQLENMAQCSEELAKIDSDRIEGQSERLSRLSKEVSSYRQYNANLRVDAEVKKSIIEILQNTPTNNPGKWGVLKVGGVPYHGLSQRWWKSVTNEQVLEMYTEYMKRNLS